MAEFGIVAAKGPQHVKEPVTGLAEPESVPEPLRPALLALVRLLAELKQQIAALEKQIVSWHRDNPCSRRLAGIDGFGPILSTAISVRVPQPRAVPSAVRRTRDPASRGRLIAGSHRNPCDLVSAAFPPTASDRLPIRPYAGRGSKNASERALSSICSSR